MSSKGQGVMVERELSEIFGPLYEDMIWLHARWQMYQQLFRHSARRTELLRDTADFFFSTLQEILLDDVVLRLARLADGEQTLGKQNLTLRQLPGRVPDAEVRIQVESLLERAIGACAFAKDQRNRRLAHRDLRLATGLAETPLAEIDLAAVDGALRAFRDVMNCLDECYGTGHVMYELLETGAGNADGLARYLAMGKAREIEVRERFSSGEPLPEDFVFDDGV